MTLTKELYIVTFPQAQHAQTMKLIWRPLDLILVVLLLAAMAFTVLRGLVSIKLAELMFMGRIWGTTAAFTTE